MFQISALSKIMWYTIIINVMINVQYEWNMALQYDEILP